MSNVIIKVEGLGKKYLIGHEKQERYTALRDVMVNGVKNWGRGLRQMFQKGNDAMVTGDEIEEFWAVNNVSFEIEKGEAIGIIGRNGAGKSTLLKLLSRITEPSTGRIEMHGRVASLLEVGTGFHPELTGRENIYLNGAVLGMTRVEIKQKFDEIVEFSGIEKFLDTPVKRYSSGMYVRLAFAVAAHLEPEILVVDEVLAVGDAEFQKKCLGKMEDVSKKEGRTVLFVSHNMGVIAQLCKKCIVLNKGGVEFFGDTQTAIEKYLRGNNTADTEGGYVNKKSNYNVIKVAQIYLTDDKQLTINKFKHDEPVVMHVDIETEETKLHDVTVGIAVLDKLKNKVFTTIHKPNFSNTLKPSLKCSIPANFLTPGMYSLDVALFSGAGNVYEYLGDKMPFDIFDNGSEFAAFEGNNYGNVFANCSWSEK
jgi:lipopolysaccharide transport system ATP-binding protein